jgi:thymidylate kinase
MSRIVFIEGPDNVGKGTQIKNIYNALSQMGPCHIVHYAGFSNVSGELSKLMSDRMYRDMFNLCEWACAGDSHLIFDRSHIGEAVYSPIYRNYSGDFVFEIEQEFHNQLWWENLELITFVDEAANLIEREDGLSFSTDPDKKQFEIELFERAHGLSNIEKKKLINIDGVDAMEVWRMVHGFMCWNQ